MFQTGHVKEFEHILYAGIYNSCVSDHVLNQTGRLKESASIQTTTYIQIFKTKNF